MTKGNSFGTMAIKIVKPGLTIINDQGVPLTVKENGIICKGETIYMSKKEYEKLKTHNGATK